MYCYSSAGVGRTGTLICVRSMIQMIEDKAEVDIFNYALKMRKKRSYMIQSEVRGFHIRSCIMLNCYVIVQYMNYIFSFCTLYTYYRNSMYLFMMFSWSISRAAIIWSKLKY